MYRLLILTVCIGGLLGCSNHTKPKPETSKDVNIIPMHTISLEKTDSVETMLHEDKKQEFYVKHHVRGNNVYVECYIPSFSFSKTNTTKEGYMNLYIDHKKIDKITTAAFIVKGLSAGYHNIKLEIIRPHSNENHWSKEFQVHIQ